MQYPDNTNVRFLFYIVLANSNYLLFKIIQQNF